jgi:hypothetical protein
VIHARTYNERDAARREPFEQAADALDRLGVVWLHEDADATNGKFLHPLHTNEKRRRPRAERFKRRSPRAAHHFPCEILLAKSG